MVLCPFSYNRIKIKYQRVRPSAYSIILITLHQEYTVTRAPSLHTPRLCPASYSIHKRFNFQESLQTRVSKPQILRRFISLLFRVAVFEVS